ncbi:MAG: sugar-binding transcriptional regulator [Chloroflexi bacterium]|uniref:sugar-binding transcriptional regulator n=1 Tax=Candidatus Flexifilum breve TaxID=3140694 RepID=UPI0031346EF7|nr:sugar-binding transcriptional regulator [Chloroflexota bacterium]MBK9745514.1 sugar-binding transcriptional regulator [Chloroflexota bacterium]
MNEDTRQLVRVATLYYKHQLLQSEIAQRVGLSRQTVGRLLQRANELGLVRVEIVQPFAYVADLELRLEAAFGLKEAVVVAAIDDDDEMIKAAMGEATAHYLHAQLHDGDILGLPSGSTTLYECALRMKPSPFRDLTVVSLTGSAPSNINKPNVDLTVMLIGQALGARTVLLPAPRFVDTADIKLALLNDSGVAAALELGNAANIVLLGIGLITEFSTPYRQGYFGKDLLEVIQKRGAVGEILGHAYDADGVLCFPEISERSIAINLENVYTKQLSIAVAGGVSKIEAILGGLRGHFFNVLITDATAARGILERIEKRKAGT